MSFVGKKSTITRYRLVPNTVANLGAIQDAIFGTRIRKSKTLDVYRYMIKAYVGEEDVAIVILLSAYKYSLMWCINATVLNFSTVELYDGDSTKLRQFGNWSIQLNFEFFDNLGVRHQQRGPTRSHPGRGHLLLAPKPKPKPARTHTQLKQPRSSMMFDMFSSTPQYSQYFTPFGLTIGPYDFLSCFNTPQGLSMDDENAGSGEENIDHREQPRR
ncbi:hypothetical protein GOBAR_DD15320 [Gossypium barbadense]|nr:hypothetical protein GOBAR_DD15320 [Gossypium barbadense]